MTDYTDPETPFPTLEARVQKREPDLSGSQYGFGKRQAVSAREY
jgi:hypothetical protein